MPEGDTIYQLATFFRRSLVGRRVVRGEVRTRTRHVLGECTVQRVSTHGKNLMIEFDTGQVLRSHLGMYGSWRRFGPGQLGSRSQRAAHVVLETEEDSFALFRPSDVELARSGSVATRRWAARWGPDLVDPSASLAQVARRARELRAPMDRLVDVLLDQRVAAGLGNVYKSEVLFLQRISPTTRLFEVDDPTLQSLFDLGRDLLFQNLEPGPRRTRPRDSGGPDLWVYGRGGEGCLVCNAEIVGGDLGRNVRITYWCEHCQKSAKGSQ